MSLTFQNAESIKQAMLEELQNLLSSETNIRQSAEARMKQLEFTEGYGVYLSELIMNQSFDLPLRQIAGIMLTRYVESHWCERDDEVNAQASEQAKKTIRNILPNGLYDQNSKIRLSVAHTISTIAITDWPNVWTELFDIIVKCLGGNEDSIHGAMLVLSEFPYDERELKELGPLIITEIYRIFESHEIYSIKTRSLAIRTLKPLLISITSMQMDKREQAEMMNSVIMNFIDKLVYYLSMKSGDNSNFMLRTEIVKIFSFFLIDMSKYIQPHIQKILSPIWQLLTQTAHIYVKCVVNQIEANPFPVSDIEEEDELQNLSTLIIQIFEFIQCIIGKNKKFRRIIKNVLTDLIYIMIVYIQVPEEQLELWNDDPEKFVEDEDETGADLTIRFSGQEVMMALNDEFGENVLTELSEAIGRHMNVAEAEKSSGNPFWWKIHEACMVATSTFEEVILSSEDKFDLPNYLTFVRNLLSFDASPHLLGRCLWTLSSFSKSSLYNPQMLEEILNVTLRSLSRDKPILLKISSVRAIQGFVHTHGNSDSEKRLLIQSKLPGFLDGIVDLVPACKSSALGLLLEALTTIISFDPTFASSVHNKLISLTIAVFLKYPEDPFIIELVKDMVKSLCQNPHCLLPLQEKFIPTIVSILNLHGDQVNTAKQDIALDVLTTIVKYSQPPLSDNLIENAFPAMIHCVLRTDDHAVMSSGGECLRAFIFVSPEQTCSYKNGEGLNYIMQLTTMLLNPMNNEMTAGQVGRLVITIILKMGNLLGENIDLLLKAVISKMQLVECLRVTMSLVVIFAYLFLTQMEAVLNFLSTVPGPTGEPAMQFLFSNWLPMQTHFFGVYERKVTTMALCKLFEYGITTQDNRLTSINIKKSGFGNNNNSNARITRLQNLNVQQQTTTIPALVNIFKLLIEELGHLKEYRITDEIETDNEDDDDDDDADNNDEDGGGGGDGRHSSNDASSNNTNDKSPIQAKPATRTTSYLYFSDDEDENSDDDQLVQELKKDPLFQANMEENLTTFLQNFSSSEHFRAFAEHLTDSEKMILKSVQVKIS